MPIDSLIHAGVTLGAMLPLKLWAPAWVVWAVAILFAAGWPLREIRQRRARGKAPAWSGNNHIEAWPGGLIALTIAAGPLAWWQLPALVTLAAWLAVLELAFEPAPTAETWAQGLVEAWLRAGALQVAAVLAAGVSLTAWLLFFAFT